jgi:hypothetical protein
VRCPVGHVQKYGARNMRSDRIDGTTTADSMRTLYAAIAGTEH